MADNPDTGKPIMQDIARAIAQQAQNLNLSAETIADLHSAARGEIDTREVVRRIYQRLKTPPPVS